MVASLASGLAACAEEARGPVRETPDVTPPVLVSGSVPEYTPEALALRVEGPVAAECLITEEGAVTNCHIVQSLPPMDDAVLRAVSTWRCSPARKDGEPVAVMHMFRLRLAMPRPAGSAPPPGVIPYHAGMTPPVMLSGKEPVFPKEALERRVRGDVIVKCVITTEGAVTNCAVEKSLPIVTQAVLDALMTRRYTPVTFNGVPMSVSYVFQVSVEPPRYPLPE